MNISLRSPSRPRPLWASLLSLAILVPGAWAGGVVTECTEAALRAAMAGGGTVSFACDGTITLAGTLSLSNATILDGTGRSVTLSGGDAVRVFSVGPGASLTLLHLTIAHGAASRGAAMLNDGGSVTAMDCVFQDNTAGNVAGGDAFGGAIYNESGLVQLGSCHFARNTARAYPLGGIGGLLGSGGALYNLGTVSIDLCTFMENHAIGSPGGTLMGAQLGGQGVGGALLNRGALDARRSTFLGNGVQGGLGGTKASAPGGHAQGGAIANYGTLQLAACTFASNVASGGDGGSGYDGRPILDIATDGGPGGFGGGGTGGGLFNDGIASAINCTFHADQGNGGSGGPGGMGGTGLRAGGTGGIGGGGGKGVGGIADNTELLALTNCTIAWAGGGGGGGGSGGPGGGGTIPGGPGPSGPGGSSHGGLDSRGGLLINTVLASNSPANCSGWLTDAGHNLSSDTSCPFTGPGSMNGVDPKLSPLADNDGPTLTMALLPGSPAIDAGNTAAAPATDQRGRPRSVGAAADIGAYEYGCLPPTLLCPTGIRVEGAIGTGAEVSFTVTATSDCDPVVTVVCTPPSSSPFAPGSTLVQCTATDSAGTTAACLFPVEVVPSARATKQAVRDDLVALRAGLPAGGVAVRSDLRLALDQAIELLNQSLDPALWVDGNRLEPAHGGRVFDREKDAVRILVSVMESPPGPILPATLQARVNQLVAADRLLASVAIEDAGTVVSRFPRKLDQALKELAKGDEETARRGFDQAIDRYQKAWEKALRAMVER